MIGDSVHWPIGFVSVSLVRCVSFVLMFGLHMIVYCLCLSWYFADNY